MQHTSSAAAAISMIVSCANLPEPSRPELSRDIVALLLV
jgi:hypothetical protein